jgi:hypothetical protein
MKLKITSLFLFFLFCIVIAFPGYGSNSSPKKATGQTSTVKAARSSVSLLSIIKKCLSKGINMIEEERNTEEEDNGTSAASVFLEGSFFQFAHCNIVQLPLFSNYKQPAYTPVCLTIFTPPDCTIS